ncbi:MAG: hypothetical protein ACTSU5_22060 [Promethearchaeota archaeon]
MCGNRQEVTGKKNRERNSAIIKGLATALTFLTLAAVIDFTAGRSEAWYRPLTGEERLVVVRSLKIVASIPPVPLPAETSGGPDLRGRARRLLGIESTA